MTENKIDVKGIRSRAVLIQVSISCWEGKVLDRKLSRNVARENKAKDDAVQTRKKLLWAEEHQKVLSLRGRIHDYVNRNTVAWQDRGPRLIATDKLMEFMTGWTELKDEWDRLVGDLVRVYPQRRDEAIADNLGDLASTSDYPVSIEDKFECALDILPVPDISDVRLDLDEENIERVKKVMEERMNTMFQRSVQDVWGRCEKVLERLVERMNSYKADPQEGKQERLYDSVIGNICELVSQMPGFNVTGDPALEQMMVDMNKSFCSVAVESLKKDAELRARVAGDAKRALNTVRSHMEGK